MPNPRPLDMKAFDPHAFEQFVTGEREKATSPRHRQILDNLLLHSRYENLGDLKSLAGVLSKVRQSYVTYGHDDYPTPSSYDEAIAFYEALFAGCVYVHHVEAEHFAVADGHVALDGVMHLVYPAAIAAMLFDVTAEEATAFQVSLRMAMVFLFDHDGLSAGEHVYSMPDATVTPIDDDDLPALYRLAIERSGRAVN